jgi:GNAT superfamily N-acetyltransferase
VSRRFGPPIATGCWRCSPAAHSRPCACGSSDSCPHEHDAVLARDGGSIIGLGSLAAGSEAGPDVPEFGLLVTDAWQGQGIGAAMVETLLVRARERGVVRVMASVLPGRTRLLSALTRTLELESTSTTEDGVAGVYHIGPAR